VIHALSAATIRAWREWAAVWGDACRVLRGGLGFSAPGGAGNGPEAIGARRQKEFEL
jgi:hypothetical protein